MQLAELECAANSSNKALKALHEHTGLAPDTVSQVPRQTVLSGACISGPSSDRTTCLLCLPAFFAQTLRLCILQRQAG